MCRFLVEVELVRCPCTRNYKAGDQFIFNGFNTPDGFCGGAYTVLYPVLMTLKYGGRFDYEKQPLCKTGIACPDKGNVLFTVSLLKQ